MIQITVMMMTIEMMMMVMMMIMMLMMTMSRMILSMMKMLIMMMMMVIVMMIVMGILPLEPRELKDMSRNVREELSSIDAQNETAESSRIIFHTTDIIGNQL